LQLGTLTFHALAPQEAGGVASPALKDLRLLDGGREILDEGVRQFFLESPDIPDAFWAYQLKPRRVSLSPIYLATLRDCFVLPDGVVVASDGSVVLESVYPATPEDVAAQLAQAHGPNLLASLQQKAGAAVERAVHCRDRGEAGYFHWVSAVLPRFSLARRHGGHDGVPHLFEPRPAFAADWLSILAPDLPLRRSGGKPVFVRELVFPAPAQVGSSHYTRNPLLLQWFRAALSAQGVLPGRRGAPGRRLYITRADAPVRRLSNEDALLARLRPFGVEKLSLTGLPVREQLRILSEASVVIGPHGAGLTNVIFADADVRVVELFPPTRNWPGFRVLTEAFGGSYAAYVGARHDAAQTDRVGAGNEDFTVDVATCARFIQSRLGEVR
jgi:capsular polysaccharide biosynthesis protein